MKNLYYRCLLMLVTSLLLTSKAQAHSAQKPIKLVATSAPVYLLGQSVFKGLESIDLNLLHAGSPHQMNLKPSQIALIDQADYIIYMAAEIEEFLQPLKSRAIKAETISLIQPVLADLRELRNADHHHDDHDQDDEHGHAEHAMDDHDEHDEHEHAEHAMGDHAEHDEHGHDARSARAFNHGFEVSGRTDFHVWLSPLMSMKMARFLAEWAEQEGLIKGRELTQLAQNLNQLDSQLKRKIKQIKQHLATQKPKYLVLHDAYGYFENYFDIDAKAIEISHHDLKKPSAVRTLHQQLSRQPLLCLWYDEPGAASAIKQSYPKLNYLLVDPAGSKLVSQGRSFISFYQELHKALVACSE